LNLTVPANSGALVIIPELKSGAVITEGGKDVQIGTIEGLSTDPDGNLIALAGKYQFEVEIERD
jgi:hypothetical protein